MVAPKPKKPKASVEQRASFGKGGSGPSSSLRLLDRIDRATRGRIRALLRGRSAQPAARRRAWLAG